MGNQRTIFSFFRDSEYHEKNFPVLYDHAGEFVRRGWGFEEFGKFYVALMPEIEISRFLSSYDSFLKTNVLADNQQKIKDAKKRFQEITRALMRDKKTDVQARLQSLEDLIAYERVLKGEQFLMEAFPSPVEGSIEYYLHRQILEENTPYTFIGYAFILGITSYWREKQNKFSFDAPYKEYLEYNRISQAFKRLQKKGKNSRDDGLDEER